MQQAKQDYIDFRDFDRKTVLPLLDQVIEFTEILFVLTKN